MYDLLIPGSLPFIIMVLIIGVILLYGGHKSRKVSRIWLTSTLCGYWLMSTYFGATWLELLLHQDFAPITDVSETRDIDAIVVLSGGGHTLSNSTNAIHAISTHTAYRSLEALRLHNMLPKVPIILSGGIGDSLALSIPESELMRKELLELGVADNLILMELNSQNTYEQAVNVAKLLLRKDMSSFILVTSHTHMRRALATFRTQNLDAMPSIAPHTSISTTNIVWSIYPTKSSLDRSKDVMREIIAYLYYKQKGWITISGQLN